MSKTIADLRSDVSRKLHGTSINKVQGEYEVYNEGAREILNDIDFYETKRTQQITNAIYADVYDYTLPTDLKGNKIIDIRPQVNRGLEDYPVQTYGMNFDRRKETQNFTIKDNSGVRSLRFNSGASGATEVHNCDSITNNGTWVVGDDATNLTEDTLNYVSGTGSLNFDVTGVGTTASLHNITLDELDLSDNENNSAFFMYVYMPSIVTNATFTWGDDLTSNYWSDTITAPQYNSFVVGWNLLRFDWDGATKTGTPDSSKVKAIKLSITYDGVFDTDYRLDRIIVPRGTIYEVEYYSKYLFKTSAGVWKEECSGLTDEIALDLEGYNILLYKVLELIAPQVFAEDASFDYSLYDKKYLTSKFRYQQKYRSEVRQPRTYYYKI
jgi:hypothetical protein